jgi:poly-gamma-glutamate synthesis protein (capsule biosynthesis protein)
MYAANDEALNLVVVGGIVAADRDPTPVGGVRAAVVPHHAVAAKSIALGVKTVASSSPTIVVVISPDHFGRCPTMLCTTKGSFTTFFGDALIDDDIVADLEKSALVQPSQLFIWEHGIYTIVPFIKHYLPDAKIVPIVVSQKSRGSVEIRDEILALLEPLLKQNGVALVISSDFSHYLPLSETQEEDRKTQASFCSANSEELLHLENPSQSDCPLCLWVLEQEAERLSFWNPVLLAHTNSAELLHDGSAKEITSHFAFALSSHAVPPGSCPLHGD